MSDARLSASAELRHDTGFSSGAIAVPWRVVTRTEGGVIEVEHRGERPVHSARFALAGDGMLGLSLPQAVYPGERLRVEVKRLESLPSEAADAMLILRWFEADGREFLWPIPLR